MKPAHRAPPVSVPAPRVAIDRNRDAIAQEIYKQLCEEIRGMGMVEMIGAKKAWTERKALADTPPSLQNRMMRIADAAISAVK